MSAQASIPLAQLQNLVPRVPPSNEIEPTSPPPPVVGLEDSLDETVRYTPTMIREQPRLHPSPLCPLAQEESPVLFETPASVGNEPLSIKLAKRALCKDGPFNQPVDGTAKKPCLPDTPSEMEANEIDAKVIESPLKRGDVPAVPMEEVREDMNTTPPLSFQKQATPFDAVKSKNLSLSTTKSEATRVKEAEPGSPLGQPRVLRGNTRVASRRRPESDTIKQPTESHSEAVVVDTPLLGKVICNKDEVISVCECVV